jgi:hypothetical protein
MRELKNCDENKAYNDADGDESISICKVAGYLVPGCVEERDSKRADEDGHVEIGHPCYCLISFLIPSKTIENHSLRSFANHTFGSTLTGVFTFLGTLTFGGKLLIA